MKELSVQEKARRYDEIIEKFGTILNLNNVKESGTIFTDDVRKILYELAESEDERIKKCISLCLEECMYKDIIRDYERDECLAWLEKQSEQKVVNNRFTPGQASVLDKHIDSFLEQKPIISDEAIREGIVHFGITQYQITNWLKKYIDVEKQDKQKDFAPKQKPKFKVGDLITDEELAQAKKDAYNDALDKIEYHSGEPTFDDGWSAAIWYLKKRNARPQTTWKPSNEQLEALDSATENCAYSEYQDCLRELIEQLKKLKG